MIILLDSAEEPPVRQEPEHGQGNDEFVSTYQGETEEGGTAHHLRIVQVSDRWI